MNTRKASIQSTKPNRVPMGRRDVLKVRGLEGQNEAFHYHWFNDVGDRLVQCLEAGYEFVSKEGLAAGDLNVDSARGTDSLMRKGVGRGTVAYLMRIPMELYEEDQRVKQKEIDAVEAEIRGSAKGEGRYGSVSLEQRNK